MTTRGQVTVWVLNHVTGEWLEYPFLGSKPGRVLVQGRDREVWLTASACRFQRPE